MTNYRASKFPLCNCRNRSGWIPGDSSWSIQETHSTTLEQNITWSLLLHLLHSRTRSVIRTQMALCHKTQILSQYKGNNSHTSVRPGMMGFPASSSAKMQPVLHRSTATPYSVAPSSSSGGRYQRVTTRLVNGCFWSGLKKVARPKSAIFRIPPLSNNRLDPFMSRWSTPCRWQCSNPRSNCCR